MEAPNCRWTRALGWGRKLCCVSATVRSPSCLPWWLAVSRCPGSSRCTTIRRRLVLSPSCSRGSAKAPPLSPVSWCSHSGRSRSDSGTQWAAIPSLIRLEQFVLVEQLLPDQSEQQQQQPPNGQQQCIAWWATRKRHDEQRECAEGGCGQLQST